MRTGIETLAGLAILANAVIYGSDVFGALVLCPAVAEVDDGSLTQVLGHIHGIADRVPSSVRQLESRWDSVINARVAL